MSKSEDKGYYINILRESGKCPLSDAEMNSIPLEDLRTIIGYKSIGLDVTPVYNNYGRVASNVKSYLGAIAVGVNPDSEELLDMISNMPDLGIDAEMRIDIMKREAAYKYLYNCDVIPTGVKDRLIDIFKRYFISNNIRVSDISEQELQFWWELIPCDDYVCYGSTRADVEVYYSVPV